MTPDQSVTPQAGSPGDTDGSARPAPVAAEPGMRAGIELKPFGRGAQAVRVPPDLRVSAAERLVAGPDRNRAARRLVETAHHHGIDLDLVWGTIIGDARHPAVGQACLAVASAGRTAMLFLSAPGPERRFGPVAVQQEELAAVLRRALAEVAGASSKPLALAQTLTEPSQPWAEAACRAAGMIWVGHLQFMRLAWPARDGGASGGPGQGVAPWPEGVSVMPVRDPLDMTPGGDGAALASALEASYADTLDCPELCGLRSTRDVITSHMATGAFDPKRWWLVRKNGVAEGCCLLNHCPANHAVELVYLGISSSLRGHGLAQRVLRHALARIDAPGVREITCAVDTRNTPALKLYRSMGFAPFGSRIGFVMPLTRAGESPAGAAVHGGGTIGTPGGQENVAVAKRL